MIGERNVTVLHGTMVTPMPAWEKRPKVREAGRVCGEDGCFTRLSVYNKDQLCFQHQPKDFRIRAPRKRKKSA